jgi:hypothetical protein
VSPSTWRSDAGHQARDGARFCATTRIGPCRYGPVRCPTIGFDLLHVFVRGDCRQSTIYEHEAAPSPGGGLEIIERTAGWSNSLFRPMRMSRKLASSVPIASCSTNASTESPAEVYCRSSAAASSSKRAGDRDRSRSSHATVLVDTWCCQPPSECDQG